MIVALTVVVPALSAGLGMMLQSMWGDEAFTLFCSRKGLWNSVDTQLGFHSVPLYPALSWAFSLGGTSLFGARLLSVLALMGCAGFLHRLTRKLFDAPTAFWAVLALVTNPLIVWYAQEARAYMLLLMFCLGSLSFGLEVLDGGRLRHVLGFGLVFLLGLMTHLYFVFFAVALALAALVYGSVRNRAKVLAVMAVEGLIVAPVVLVMFVRSTGSPYVPPHRALLDCAGYVALAFGFGFSFGPTSEELHGPNPMAAMMPYLPGAVALMAAFWSVVLVGGWRLFCDDRRRFWMVSSLLALPVLLPLVIGTHSQHVTFNVRYSLPAVPFALVAFAYGVSHSTPRWSRVLVVLLFAVQGAGLIAHYTATRYWKEDYQAMLSLLQTEARDEDPILFSPYPGPLSTFLDRPVQLLSRKTLDNLKASGARGFCVINRPWMGDPSGDLQRELDGIPGVRSTRLRGFVIYVLPARPPS